MKAALFAFSILLTVLVNAQQRHDFKEVNGIPQIEDEMVDDLVEELKIPAYFNKYLEREAFTECSAQKVAEVLLVKINAYRLKMGRHMLHKHDQASLIAKNYAELLVARNVMEHRLDGTTPTSRMKAAFPKGVSAGENLHTMNGSIRHLSVNEYTDRVLISWIRSPGHHKLLLMRGELAAVGVHRSDDNTMRAIAAFNVLWPLP